MNDELQKYQNSSLQLQPRIPHQNIWLRKFVSKQTQKTYLRAIQDFIYFHGLQEAEELQHLDQGHVIEWREELLEQGLSHRSINTKLSALSSLLKFLCEKQVVRENVTTGIQRPKVTANKVESPILTSQQVRKMLDSPDTSSFKGLRDWVILHIFFYTGCRISEISYLKVQDFYEDGGYWVLNLKTKGGGHNRIAINQELHIAIRLYLEERGKKQNPVGFSDDGQSLTVEKRSPLIISLKRGSVDQPLSRYQTHRIFHEYARKAGLPENIRPHSARATFITNALENGASIESVQQTADHAWITTTQMYDKRSQEYRESASFAVRW